MQYIGQVRVRQCRQANDAWGFSSGSTSTTGNACDSSDQLLAGSLFDREGYPNFGPVWHFTSAPPIPNPLSWADATNEIDDGRPFAFSRVEVGNGVEHMMVVRGYVLDTSGHEWLCVMDPHGFRVPSTAWVLPYADYAGNSAYQHVVTYYDIKPQ